MLQCVATYLASLHKLDAFSMSRGTPCCQSRLAARACWCWKRILPYHSVLDGTRHAIWATAHDTPSTSFKRSSLSLCASPSCSLRISLDLCWNGAPAAFPHGLASQCSQASNPSAKRTFEDSRLHSVCVWKCTRPTNRTMGTRPHLQQWKWGKHLAGSRTQSATVQVHVPRQDSERRCSQSAVMFGRYVWRSACSIEK